jgi:hypothetical protein
MCGWSYQLSQCSATQHVSSTGSRVLVNEPLNHKLATCNAPLTINRQSLSLVQTVVVRDTRVLVAQERAQVVDIHIRIIICPEKPAITR